MTDEAANPNLDQEGSQADFVRSWERLNPQEFPDKVARRIFCMTGYCASETPISPDVFYPAMADLDVLYKKDGAIEDALIRLVDLRLVDRTQNGICIRGEVAEFARVCGAAVADITLSVLADSLAELAYEAAISGRSESCNLFRLHLPVVAEWAEKARLARAVALWSCLGSCQFMSKELSLAKKTHGRALRLSEKTLGFNHARTALCMCNLAKVYRELGKETFAKNLDQKAHKIFDKRLGENDPHTASALNDLGSLLHQQGDLAMAKEYLSRAVGIYSGVNGENDPFLATASYNLGTVLQDLGDMDGALIHYQRALRIDEPLFGPEHPKVVIVKQRIRDLSNGGDEHRTL